MNKIPWPPNPPKTILTVPMDFFLLSVACSALRVAG
jgi:hypothetical protein